MVAVNAFEFMCYQNIINVQFAYKQVFFVFEILTESSDNEDDDEEEEEEDVQEPEAPNNKNGETGNDSETVNCKNGDRTENHDKVEDET